MPIRLQAPCPPLPGPPRSVVLPGAPARLVISPSLVPQLGAPGRPPLLLSLGALHPSRARRYPRSQAWGLLSLPLGPRPPSGDAPPPSPESPGRSPAWGLLGPSRLSVILASFYRQPAPRFPSPALGPFLAAQANLSGHRRSPPCPSVRRSISLAPRPRSSVLSLQPRAVRQASAPQAFRPFSQPRSLTSQSTGLPSLISLASGVSAPTECQVDTGGPSPSVRLGCPGPGLLALGRASQPRPPPPNSRAILAGPLNIRDSPAQSSPSVSQFGAHSSARQSSLCCPGPAGFAPDRASWPRPPRPPARPLCGSICRFGPGLYSAQPGQSRNSCSDPTVWLPVPRAGPCPGPPGLAPRAPRPLGRLRSLPEIAPHPATYPTPRSPEPPYGRSPPARTARTGRGERWGPRPSSSLAPPPGTWPPWSLPPLPHRTSNSGRARPRAPPSWGGARARE